MLKKCPKHGTSFRLACVDNEFFESLKKGYDLSDISFYSGYIFFPNYANKIGYIILGQRLLMDVENYNRENFEQHAQRIDKYGLEKSDFVDRKKFILFDRDKQNNLINDRIFIQKMKKNMFNYCEKCVREAFRI